MTICPPSKEWNKAKTLCVCLKKFYDLTELFSGTLYPTANLFYKGFCDIKLLLADWCASSDMTISKMARAMTAKFNKYWEKSNIALAVANFLDPRYKRKIVEFYTRKICGDVRYQTEMDEFNRVLKHIYQFYASSAPISSKNDTTSGPVDDRDNGDDEFESYMFDSYDPAQDLSNELEKYIAAAPVKASKNQW